MGNYKIVVETTNSMKKAEKHINTLKKNNISCYIVPLKIGNQTLYNVQAGPFSYKKDALINIDKIKGLGVRNAFITTNAIS